MENPKQEVKAFWNEASCGEVLYFKGNSEAEQYQNQLTTRYKLEPYIPGFADFKSHGGKRVLEVGVGLGADHQMFAQNGAILSGCDLTERAISLTKKRFEIFELQSDLRVADAENLPYDSETFDVVYSWGVIHHSPNTPKAVEEIRRVLKQGGMARIMIYYKYSFVGFMLWFRYAFLGLKPFTSLAEIYSRYLESPGTKAYSVPEAEALFKNFSEAKIDTVLTHGDLLSSDAGQRHQGAFLTIARKIYPRRLVSLLFPKNGLFMLISATK